MPRSLPKMFQMLTADSRVQKQQLEEIIQSCLGTCTQPDPEDPSCQPFRADAIVSNPPVYAHVHIAEKLKVWTCGASCAVVVWTSWCWAQSSWAQGQCGFR